MFVVFINIIEFFSIVVCIGIFFVIEYVILLFVKVCIIVGINIFGGVGME